MIFTLWFIISVTTRPLWVNAAMTICSGQQNGMHCPSQMPTLLHGMDQSFEGIGSEVRLEQIHTSHIWLVLARTEHLSSEKVWIASRTSKVGPINGLEASAAKMPA